MKQLITSIAFMAVFTAAYPQANSKNYLRLNAGASFPVGRFGSDEVKPGISYNGLAKTGYHVGLAYGRYFKPNWGIQVSGRCSSFPRNTDTLFYVYWPAGYQEIFGVKSEPYRMGSFTAGMFYDFFKKQKITVSGGFGLGLLVVTYPYVFLWQKVNLFNEATLEAENDLTFTYNLEFTGTYQLSQKSKLILGLRYMHAQAEYEVFQRNWLTPNSPAIPVYHSYRRQSISSIDTSVGFIYFF
ncbi:MAG: hypothetical protein ACK4RF_08700 [Cyclobacteriaceae bacterium]